MIIGVGTDLTEMKRIQEILSGKRGTAFLRRILTAGELALLEGISERRRAEFAAGRWAAKEAVSKALGCGIGGALGFQDIEVLPDALGKPLCFVSEAVWDHLGFRAKVHLSITHTNEWAAAFAVAERLPSERPGE